MMNLQVGDPLMTSRRKAWMVVFSVISILFSITLLNKYFHYFSNPELFYIPILLKVFASIHTFILCCKKGYLDSKNIHYVIQVIGSIGCGFYIFFGFYFLIANFPSFWIRSIWNDETTGIRLFVAVIQYDAVLFIGANIMSYLTIKDSMPLSELHNIASAPNMGHPQAPPQRYYPPAQVEYGKPAQVPFG